MGCELICYDQGFPSAWLTRADEKYMMDRANWNSEAALNHSDVTWCPKLCKIRVFFAQYIAHTGVTQYTPYSGCGYQNNLLEFLSYI
jgi:hypothetical protein